ncbi:MAG: thioredoxin family protein [Spirochaetales bacterium]|nr:thioredoxin family protein [Spirochaetales bacterium]
MLNTNLKHLMTEEDVARAIKEHASVMICCGRMGPMCIPVYRAMEKLENRYPRVAFRDIDFDSPAADGIKALDECAAFMSLPFTVYYKEGRVAAATSGIQSEKEITERIERSFQ